MAKDDTSCNLLALLFFGPTYLVVEKISELELIISALGMVEPWTMPDVHEENLYNLSFHVVQKFREVLAVWYAF